MSYKKKQWRPPSKKKKERKKKPKPEEQEGMPLPERQISRCTYISMKIADPDD
jgi:hypothetical protein